MITQKEITDLCECAIGTRYQSLLMGIRDLTVSIENHLESRGNIIPLESFQKEYNQRFHNLFSLVFEPISQLEPLPADGDFYTSVTSNPYSSVVNKSQEMSSCTFIDREPYLASAFNQRLTQKFIEAVTKKLPLGYTIEFVGNNSQACPIVCTVKNGLLYLVESNKHDSTKINLKPLLGYVVDKLPVAILTTSQCAENHAQSFITGFIDLFNMYYPSCEWRYLSKDFQVLVWDEYIRYIGKEIQTGQKYFFQQLEIYARSKYSFMSTPFSYFANEQEKLKLKYMASFCKLYNEMKCFPLYKHIVKKLD